MYNYSKSNNRRQDNPHVNQVMVTDPFLEILKAGLVLREPPFIVPVPALSALPEERTLAPAPRQVLPLTDAAVRTVIGRIALTAGLIFRTHGVISPS